MACAVDKDREAVGDDFSPYIELASGPFGCLSGFPEAPLD